MKREQLYDHLGWLTNASVNFELLCRRPTPGDLGSYVVKNRCLEYRQFGVVHWTELHDLDPLRPYVNFRFQDMVSLEQLQYDLGIDEEDTYVHVDEHLYDWKLYEDLSEAKHLLKTGTNFFDSFGGRRYYKVYTLEHWRRRPERLLQLGGIFSSTRISLTNPRHIALREKIASALHYRRDNTAIGETVQRIVDYLGGKGTYVGVHFRTGDSPFKRQINQNMVLFAQGLANLTGASITLPELSPTAITGKDEDDPSRPNRMMLLPSYDGLNTPPWSRVCEPVPADGRPITSGSRTTIYIATDHRDPRGPESQLLPWFDMYPCTVTLGDLPDYLFDPLDRVHDYIVPGKSLRPFLIPIVDGMVAAHASQVFITPRSTYSRYIEDMNRAWR
ncbi:hypothetical protein BX666DRAFT_1856310 [Dichotomocladium elegans]|nr:hypothetical protein BX666DRAFT_1856310 [Dichotomocladium elegans]